MEAGHLLALVSVVKEMVAAVRAVERKTGTTIMVYPTLPTEMCVRELPPIDIYRLDEIFWPDEDQ
jgi:hypothetical protein